MAVDARSYFAARGDLELVGLNRELGRLPIALDAFVDFAATRRNDGVQLGIFYRPVRALTLLAAAPDDGGWFLENAFADHVDLVFSAPVDKSSVSLGTFAWWWAGGTEEVDPVDIVFSELDRQLRIEKPTLPADYTGPLSLTFADVDSAETDPLAEAITLQYDITETGSAKPQTGAKSYERQIVTGSLAVSRLVIPTGQQVDAMLKAFLRHKGLESHRILKVVQVQGPNTTVEVFLLWWRATSPRLVSVSPKSSGTLPFESPPESVVLQFDQPVQSPAAYLHFDDVLGTNVAFTTTKLDEQGRQWQIVKSGGLFTAVGQHTLRIAGLPNLTGDLPGPPSVFSWQVQPLTVSGSSDHGDLGGLGDNDHPQYLLAMDDDLDIVPTTPPAGSQAVATNVRQHMYYDGTDWWIGSGYYAKHLGGPDMGHVQGSNLAGYGLDYITDKILSSCGIGRTAQPSEGQIKQDGSILYIYLAGSWQPVVANLTIRESAGVLQHKPIGYTTWINVLSGNSVNVGLNGRPLVNGYVVSMGAYPPKPKIHGGVCSC